MTESTQNRKESNFVTTIRRHDDIFIGVDVHKRTYALTAHSRSCGFLKTISAPAEPEGLVRLLNPHAEGIRRVVYEAGPSGYKLVRTLRDAGFSADVVVTGTIPRPSTKAAKNDAIDSRTLAEFAAKDVLKYVRIPSLDQEAQREVLRTREKAREDLTRAKNRIRMFLQQHGLPEPDGLDTWSKKAVKELGEAKLDSTDLRFCLDELLRDHDYFDKKLSACESRLRRVVKRKDHATGFKRLTGIPGVGLITASTFLLEAYSPDRFPSKREIAKYCGLSPQEHQSGDRNRRVGLSPSGNRHLRHVLIEAAWQWVARDPNQGSRFRRLAARLGNSQKAITATARKLSIVMWRMLIDGTDYESRPDDFSIRPSAG